MGEHLYDHLQGHIDGVFRPFPLPTGSSGPSGDGLIIEDGSGFLLLEDSNYLLLE
jgi:hypothetical protein